MMAIDPHPYRHPAGEPRDQQPTPSHSTALDLPSMYAGKQSNDNAVAAGETSTSNCTSAVASEERSVIDDERLSLSSSGHDHHAAPRPSSTHARQAQDSNSIPRHSSSTPPQEQKQKRKTVSSAKLWTKHEDDVIRAGVARFGTSWKRVSSYFATEAPQNHRTVTALTQHYHLFLKGGRELTPHQPKSRAGPGTAARSAAAPAQGSRGSISFSSSSSVLPSSCVGERTTSLARLRVELEEGEIRERQPEGMQEGEASKEASKEVGQEGRVDSWTSWEDEAQGGLMVAREGNEEGSELQQTSGQDSPPQPMAHNPSQSGQDAPQAGVEDHEHLPPSPSLPVLQSPPTAVAPVQLTKVDRSPTSAQLGLDYSIIALEYGFRFECLPLGCELSIFTPTHYRLRSIAKAQAELDDRAAAAAAFTFHILAEGSVVGVNLPPGTKTHAAVVSVDECAKVGDWMIETHFDAECGFEVVFAVPLWVGRLRRGAVEEGSRGGGADVVGGGRRPREVQLGEATD